MLKHLLTYGPCGLGPQFCGLWFIVVDFDPHLWTRVDNCGLLSTMVDSDRYGLNSINTPKSHSFKGLSFTQHINPTDEGKLARNHGLGVYKGDQ